MATLWKILKRAGVVIGPLMFIGSVALAARDIAEWGLQWYWWAAIGGGIFFASGLAVIWGQQKEINKLKKQLDTKPSIQVKPINEFDDYYLEVKNIGSTGTFNADIQIMEGWEHITPYGFNQYKACWEATRGREAKILKDQTDRIKIAHLVSYPPSTSQHLNLYYYDPQSSQENYVHSDTHWVGATITSENGKERPLPVLEFILKVTISAEEGLREGSFTKKYKLGFSGLEELPNQEK